MNRQLFVYGTLRIGDYNDQRFGLAAEATHIVQNCQASGRMYNVDGEYPIYPVVDFNRDGTVVGDLLTIPADSIVLASIDRMERNAGYELRTVTINMPFGGITRANVYHYDVEERQLYRNLHPIPSGDWLAWSSQASYET